MPDDDLHTRLAVTETKQNDIERRVTNLEGNQKWVVGAILAAVVKGVMDLLKWGAGQ
jgi:hypothetical protein